MNNKERDEKFLKSWLKKKISITTSTVVSFLITGAVGGGTAYGVNANGSGNGTAVAVGTQSNSTAGGVAVGRKAQATGNEGAVAVGVESSTNQYGVAIGYKAGAENATLGAGSYSNITIGANTKVGEKNSTDSVGQSIAIGSSQGNGAWAKGTQAIAIGADTIAEGDSSVVIGGDDIDRAISKTKSYVKKSYDKNDAVTNTAVNNQSLDDIYKDLTGNTSGLGGYRGTTAGEASVALGVKAAAGDLATALGTMSEAKGINSLALGTGALATQVNAVAVGAGSSTEGLKAKRITDANIGLADGTNVNFSNFAGASNVTEGDMVSFGTVGRERQLKNIAPGELSATSTDAATGSQLFSVAKKLSEDINSKFRYVSIKSNDAGNKLNDGATANNAIAIGPNASTKVESAVSLGDGANIVAAPTTDKAGKLLQTVMSSGSGVAIGKNASAVQAGVAIGDTSSTVTSGIAIGREAKVTNKYESASGPYVVGDSQDGYLNYDRVQNPDNLQYSKTEATGNNIFSPDRYNGQGIAIGYKAESNMFGTSLGNSAVAKQGGLALGTFSRAEGATATAIGLGANSSGARGISMGRQASATTDDSVAIGTGARGGATSAGGSVAVGGGAAATGTQAIAIGGLYGSDLYSSSATKDGAGNLTKNTQASGEASIAMGVNTKATGKQALAMGSDAQATGKESTAIGINAKATGVQAITMGSTSEATAEKAIAIGAEAKSRASESVAIGSGTVSNRGIAIGKNSTSGGFSSSISLGTNATSNFGGIAIGENATAQSNSIVIGSGTRTPGSGTVVIGDDAGIGSASGKNAKGENSIAIGKGAGKNSDANTYLYNTITIGAHSKVGETGKARVSQSIAIGGVADLEANKGGATWARGDQSIAIGGDVKSLGDSSIAIGGDDLDMVSSANSTYSDKKFDKSGNQIAGGTKTDNLNNIFNTITGRGKILAGGTGTDGQTYDRYNGTKSGQGAVALGVKSQSGDIALAIGTFSEAKGTNSVAIGTGAQTPQSGAVAIGGGSTTYGLQGRQITDADITLTDGTTMALTNFAGASGVLEGSMVSFGKAGNERQLKHIAPGEISATSTDGINGSQLYAVAKTLGEGWKADAGGNKIGSSTLTSVKPGNTVVYSAGSNLQVKQTVDATNGKQTYEYSLNKDLTGLDSVTTKTITIPGATPGTNDVVIGKDGINAGSKPITNVAPGVNGKDAVNKNQLDQKIGDNTIKLGGDKGTTGTQNLSQAGGLQFNIKGGDGLETSASGTDVTVQLDTVTKQKLNKAVLPLKFSGDDYDPFDEVSTVVSKELGQKLEIVGGADTTDPTKLSNNNIGTMVDGTGKVNIKLAKELKDLTSAEFKTPAGDKTVINGDGLTVNPAAPGAAPISVTKDGISAGDKKVTNVAPGTISATSKDAINGSQFHGLAKNTIQLGGDNATTTNTQTLDKTGGIKFDIVGANGITTEAKDGKVTVSVDPSKLSAGNSKLSYTANGDTTKQEVKLSDGLNFTDGKLTTASVAANGVVKYDVKTTTLTSTDGKVTVPTTDGVATAKDVANAINNSGWQANADATGTGAKTGTPSAKLVKNGSTVTYVAGNNLTVAQDVDTNGNHKYTYSLNKDLKDLDSVTTKTITIPGATPGTNDVVIGKDGINAGNKPITNVADGVNGKDAVNKSQLDKIGDNEIKLGGDNTTVTAGQKLSKTGGLQFNIKGANGIETSAAGTDVTVKLDAATRGKIDNAADKNLSNLTPAGIDKIKDTAAWKVKANSNAAETVKGGDEVVFKDGAGVTITQSGKEFTIAADTSKISKDTKISYTANGAAPKKEVSLADGFNFEDGKLTTATVDTAGKVKYDVKTTTLTSTDGKVTVPTTDGVATAKDVANAINNSGWKANAGGNVDGTSASTLVKAGDEVVFKAGDNLTVKQDLSAGKQEYTYKLNKDLTGLDSVTSKTITVPGAPGTNDVVIGKDGISAGNKVIKDVAPGVNGTDAVNKNQLDTTANNLIDKGMNFSADDYDPATANTTVSKKLGERLEIVGGADKTKLSNDNIGSVVDNTGKINVKLAKELKDLTSAEFKTPAGDKTVINGDGLTVSPATPTTSPISVTKDGISAGDKKVTNVAPGTISKTSTDAINGSQLYNLSSNTIQLGGDNASTTDKQTLDKSGGIKFDIVGANGITTEAKDGKVTVKVDSSTIGANSKLKYTANGDAPKQEVTLADGLNFKNGNFTTATVGANGEVKYDTVTQGLNVSPNGKASLPNPATPGGTTPNGLVTAQDVANALNSVGWNATADATGTGVKTGTPSAQLVKNGSTVSYVAGDNLAVEQNVDANGNHKYTYSLNKQLKDLTSAEFVNPTSGNKTVVNGDGLTITPSTPGAKNISITKDGISAGDKKITDVADGDITPTSKDAINGSQLYKLASNTIQLGGDGSTVTATQQLNKNGGIKFNIVGDNGIITEAKDDKVIVRVNPATIGSNITLKYAANGANGQTVKLSDGLNFQDGNFTKASVDTAGKVKYDTVTQAIAPTADGTAQVAPGSTPGLATSADVVNAINNSGWKATAGGNVTGTPTSTVVKNGQEVEFNAGDNLKVKQTIDPTTGKQTYEYSLNKDLTGLNSAEFTNAAGDKTKITAGNTEYTNAAGDKTVVNAGGLTISSSTPGAKDISVTKDGISAGDKVIKNVAAGVNDTDAVNVSQLKDVDNKITNVNNTINKGLNFKGNTGATVNKQLGDTLEIVGEGTKADSEYSGQNLKVVEDGGKLVVKMDKNLKSDTVTADTVNTNSVTVGAPGKDGVITVKDANGKDGVSINGKDGSIGLNGKDGSSATISTVQGNPGVAGTPGTTMDRIQYTDNSGTPHQVATLDDGMKYGGDTGAVINKKLNQQVNVVGGITDVTKLAANDNIGVVSDGSNNLKVRLAKDLDGLESVKVRDTAGNSTVVKGDGVTITSSSGDTVSLTDKGLDNGGNVITNVAAGKDGTDAVNVDQLNQTVGNVVNAAGDAIAHVNNKVDKLGDRVNKGLAGAAAMAGLEFMDIGINQATVAAAVGGYRGTHAVAVGIQAAPTENTRINAKVSMTPGSRTETMYSVGASYRFNWR